MIDDPMVPAVEAGKGRLSATMLAAIDHALAVRPEHRPQTVAEWRGELLGDVDIPEPVPLSKAAPPRTSRVVAEPPRTSKVPAAKKTERPSAEAAAKRARSRPKPKATQAVPGAAQTIMVDEPKTPAKGDRTAGEKGRGGRMAMVAVAAVLVAAIGLAAVFLGRPGGDPEVAKLEFAAEEQRLIEMVRRAARKHAARVVRNRGKRKAAVSKKLVTLISGGQVSFTREQGVGRHEARWTFHQGGRLEGAAFVSDGGGGDEMRSLSDRGKWWVKGNTLCIRWTQWDKGRTRCYAISQARGGRYQASGGGGVLAGIFRLEK